ncbi:MAG: YbhB/YbcL family Raf kinase inhibitor-like protein [Acidimicrobiales bacterium]
MIRNLSHRCRRGALALFAISALATSLTACGTSGRTLEDPKPGATAPARKNSGSTVPANASPTTTAVGAQISSTSFTLKATAWATGQSIPKPYTCDGVNTSPPFAISGVPTKTVELIFVATNQNFASQTLWLMAGIAPATVSLPQGGVPSGAIQIVNSSGSARWSGPCPVTGTNIYEFAIYALTSPSGLTTSATYADVNAAIATATAASVITGSYSR